MILVRAPELAPIAARGTALEIPANHAIETLARGPKCPDRG